MITLNKKYNNYNIKHTSSALNKVIEDLLLDIKEFRIFMTYKHENINPLNQIVWL